MIVPPQIALVMVSFSFFQSNFPKKRLSKFLLQEHDHAKCQCIYMIKTRKFKFLNVRLIFFLSYNR